MKLLHFLLFLFITTNLTAQPTTKDYETKTIYAVDGKYMYNNTPLSIKEMVKLLSNSNTKAAPLIAMGYVDYKKAKTYSIISGSLAVVGLTALLFSGNGGGRVASGVILGSIIPSIIAAKHFRRANKNFANGIWKYNMEALFPTTN